MVKITIRAYRRKGKIVRSHTRTKRPIGKKKIVTKEKFYLVRDEYGQLKGYKPIRGKK